MEPQIAAPVIAPAPAPVASPSPATQPATAAAVTSGKTLDYRAARRAERAGQPMAAVPATVAPAATDQTTEAAPSPAVATTPEPRKARDQQYISDRIREGVDRGTAELRAEIERIKQHIQAPPAAAREPQKAYDGVDPSDPKPAPDNFETHDAYLAARDEWNERRIERKQATAATGVRVAQEREELTAAQQARVQKFADQLKTATTADPEFSSKLTPAVRALKPFAALAPGERGGPEHIVAEQVFDSPIAPQVLLHLSAHPDALARLIAMPAEIQAMPQRVRTHHHIQWIVKEFGKLEAALSAPPATDAPAPVPSTTLTSAPSPAQTLGSRPAAAVDPKAAAVKSGNTQAYRELRRHERAVQMGRR